MDDQIIELYNSSALESLHIDRKIVSSQGVIDFQVLDTFYQENKESLAHLGGKSSLLMTAFCQMNSFNIDNVNRIRESMRQQENDLAKILHHSFTTTENKFLVLANKINQMDSTTINVVAEFAAMIHSESSQRLSGAQNVEAQLSSVATHFSNFALKLDELTLESSKIAKDCNAGNTRLQGALDIVQQQLAGLTEVAEGLAASQTSLKKANDTLAKDGRAAKLQLLALQTEVNEAENKRDRLESECASLMSRIRSTEDQLANKFKSTDIKISQLELGQSIVRNNTSLYPTGIENLGNSVQDLEVKLTSLDRLVQSNRLVIKQFLSKQSTDEELHQEQLRRIDYELAQLTHKLDAQELVAKVRKVQEPIHHPPHPQLDHRATSNQSPMTVSNSIRVASEIESSTTNDWSKALPKFKKHLEHQNQSKPGGTQPIKQQLNHLTRAEKRRDAPKYPAQPPNKRPPCDIKRTESKKLAEIALKKRVRPRAKRPTHFVEPVVLITSKDARILIGEASVIPIRKVRDLLWDGTIEQEWLVSYKPPGGKEFTLSIFAKQGMFTSGVAKIAKFARSGDRSMCLKTWNVAKVFYPKPVAEKTRILEIPSIKVHPENQQESNFNEKWDFSRTGSSVVDAPVIANAANH